MTFNKVEPIPVVGVAPDSDPVVCLAINTSWVEIIIGLIEKANWAGFWAGTDAEIDQVLTHVIQLAGMMVGGECRKVQYAQLFHSSDEHAGGAVGGWNIRELNGVTDPSGLVELVGDSFVPIAGDYVVRATSTGIAVGSTRIALIREDPDTEIVSGVREAAVIHEGVPWLATPSLSGSFTSDGVDSYGLWQLCALAMSGYGLGFHPGGAVDSVYTTIDLFRLA